MTPILEWVGKYNWRLSPHQILVLGFTSAILLGTMLLTLPMATRDGMGLGFVDALFEATSAVCVTGLAVVDTHDTFTLFGQLVMLFLVQIGGLGIMTSAAFFFLLMGKKINLRERMVMQESLNHISIEGIVRLIRYVLIFTFSFELVGALFLGLRFSQDLGWAKGMYYGLFHAVAAFSNAGFDLFGGFRGLKDYVGDPVVNITIPLLIIAGGIGFTVILDLYNSRRTDRLSLHTKLALITTGFLLATTMVLILLLEWNNAKTLGDLAWGDKLWAAWFQSVTPRSGGYNTLAQTDLTAAAAFLTIIMMFIGAAPGSTGGGIKVTTFAALGLAALAMVRGKEEVNFLHRRIPQELIYKSLTITISASGLVFFVTMLLAISEPHIPFLALLFEATSAFGTVGLSMGVSPILSDSGKVIVALTMFIGRLGPLTLALAIAQKRKRSRVRYPEEKIIVG